MTQTRSPPGKPARFSCGSGALDQPGKGELRRPVDGDEKTEPAFAGAQFGKAEMEMAATMASAASVRIVERGTFGPVRRSSGELRLRHFITVFGLMPQVRPSAATEACDRCIAARIA